MKKNLLLFCLLCIGAASFAQVDVTFRVDMTGVAVSAAGVHVAGDLNGWNTSGTPLTNVGNNVYTATVSLAPGSDIGYKFLNGNAWGTEEVPPATCSVGGNNRIFTVPAAAVSLDIVPFNGCAANISTRQVTFKVDMTGVMVSAAGVHVAGNFQGWNPGATAMTAAGNNIYTATVQVLSTITTLQYKFLNGNAWGTDEDPPTACQNSGNNRFFEFTGTAPVTLNDVFNGCTVVAPTKPVKFSVDMTGQTVSANGIHVAGDFQGWNPGATAMTKVSGNIYAVTVEVPVSTAAIEYKYVNGNAWGTEEDPPAACQNAGNNRAATLATGQNLTILPTYVFGSCSITLGTAATFEPKLFTVSPNLTADFALIRLELANSTDVQLTVTDILGKTFLSEPMRTGGGLVEKELSVGTWPSGIYLIHISGAEGQAVRRLMVRK
jgi:hypothetical protein